MRQIFFKIAELTDRINIYDHCYYSKSFSLISDAEYDELRLKYREVVETAENLSDRTPNEVAILKKARRLLSKVYDAKFGEHLKVRHLSPMLSLSNAFSESDIKAFWDRMQKLYAEYLAQSYRADNTNLTENSNNKRYNDTLSFSAELKIDGVSFSAIYKNGHLNRGITRGDGEIGENITQNVAHFIDLPLSVPFSGTFEIRGEAYICANDFISLNDSIRSVNGRLFANARNAAAGSIRLLDHKLIAARKVRYFAWDCFVYDDNDDNNDSDKNKDKVNINDDLFHRLESEQYETSVSKRNILKTQMDVVTFLKKNGFLVNEFTKKVSSIEEIEDFYSSIYQNRASLGYDVDGIVLKANNRQFQWYIGNNNTSPRWAIAYKFPSLVAWTRLSNISLQVSRHGVLTPVANLVPISVGGVVVSRATLHNVGEIRRKDIKVGDLVCVKRAGDVIPKITGVNPAVRNGNEQAFVFPENCPSCGTKLIDVYSASQRRIQEDEDESDNIDTDDIDGYEDCEDRDFAKLLFGGINERTDIKLNVQERESDRVAKCIGKIADISAKALENSSAISKHAMPKQDDVVFKVCPNSRLCPEQKIERIIHFTSRDGFDIEGLGDAQVRFLFLNYYIQNELDIFTLEERKFTAFNHREKLSAHTSKNVKDEIEGSPTNSCLENNALEQCQGWGKKSVDNLAQNIKKARNIELSKLIYALGVPHVGTGIAKVLAKELLKIAETSLKAINFPVKNAISLRYCFEQLMQKLQFDLYLNEGANGNNKRTNDRRNAKQGLQNNAAAKTIAIAGIGRITAESIVSYLSNGGLDFIEKLENHLTSAFLSALRSASSEEVNLDAFLVKDQELSSDIKQLLSYGVFERLQEIFSGKTIVITGTVSGFTRTSLKKLFESVGARVTDAVSGATDYVVFGDSPGKKMTDATKYNVPTLDASLILQVDAKNSE